MRFFVCFMAMFCAVGLGFSDDFPSVASTPDGVVQVALTPDHKIQAPGASVQVIWNLRLSPGWHIYFSNPGDSGLPPKVSSLNPLVHVGSLEFPTPKLVPTPPIMNYGYEGDVLLRFPLALGEGLVRGDINIPLNLSFLYCKDICLPGRLAVGLPLTVGDTPTLEPLFVSLSERFQAGLPRTTPISVSAVREGSVLRLEFPFVVEGWRFIPLEDGLIDDAFEQKAEGNRLLVSLDATRVDPVAKLKGLLVHEGQSSVQVEATVGKNGGEVRSSTSGMSLGLAIVFAFLAGLILNLMPCVLPVLSLKVLGLVKTHHGNERVAHVLFYTVGVVLAFAVIGLLLVGLRQGGAVLGWGFQLQSPAFVAALVLVTLAVALNLWGVFEIGQSLSRLGGHSVAGKETNLSALFTGILAVVVATPCTVPFMGGATAFALSVPMVLALPVFLALGIGMASPFLLLAFMPRLLAYLPKPGPWMLTFKHVLAWPMLMTSLWLVWVFSNQTNPVATFGLLSLALVFAFSLWFYGLMRRWLFLSFPVVLFLWGGVGLLHGTVGPQLSSTVWKPWSEVSVIESLKSGPVFVDVTADWCITCKVQEATVLNTEAVQKLFKDKRVSLFRADWTRGNEEITAFLERFGRRGVPLYVLYKPGMEPLVLPQILTFSVLESALK